MIEITERFGNHVHILDWALHLDESTPHIHERHVFDWENQYGELFPQQEKALKNSVLIYQIQKSQPTETIIAKWYLILPVVHYSLISPKNEPVTAVRRRAGVWWTKIFRKAGLHSCQNRRNSWLCRKKTWKNWL